jgi:hypothetical protein
MLTKNRGGGRFIITQSFEMINLGELEGKIWDRVYDFRERHRG